MNSVRVTGAWRRFFVIEAGRTSAAQKVFVDRLIREGHIQVNSEHDSDYYVVVCPISSRVGTDVCEAERMIPGNYRLLSSFLTFHVVPDAFDASTPQNLTLYNHGSLRIS